MPTMQNNNVNDQYSKINKATTININKNILDAKFSKREKFKQYSIKTGKCINKANQ